jgi:hypothetical protein
MNVMVSPSKKWKYRNTTLLLISFVVLFFVSDTEVARAIIREIGSYGYLGAFVTGILFVSTFTVAPASVVLFHLAQDFDPIKIALAAGAGGALGDLLIFRFLRDGVFEELRPFYRRYGGSYLNKLLRMPYFAWLAPVIGAILIASPFPDEIGIGLMGLSKIKTWQFACLVFVLDSLGVLAIVLLARSL